MQTLKFEARPGTLDEVVIVEVLRRNAYLLPERFSKTDVILDIGAHIGAFAFLCLARGAGHVWCYEPDHDNFQLLETNTAPFLGCHRHRKAVWRSDRKEAVTYSGYTPVMTACGSCLPGVEVDKQNQHLPVDTISLDEILQEAGQVRLLKIDAEGAEFPVLSTCTRLAQVQEICGEVHEIGMEMDIPISCTMQGLGDFLYDQGFKDVLTSAMQGSTMMFWAKR